MEREQQLRNTLAALGCLPDLASAAWVAPLVEKMVRAEAHWPSFALSWDAFCDAVGRALQTSISRLTPEAWAAQCTLEDLYLSCACLAGDEEAIQAFKRDYDRVLWAIVQRFAKPPLMPDELYQELWIRLFVQLENRTARLVSYAAQGPLVGWLRVTAVRACIDYMRAHNYLAQEQVTEKEELAQLPQEALDVELEFLKREYRGHFRESFAAAIKALSSHDRLLLRYHVVEKLSIDQIGVLMQFHRSTAARHLEQARGRLLLATEEQLMQRLQISKEEFQSIIGLIQSRWDVSVQRLLEASQISLVSEQE